MQEVTQKYTYGLKKINCIIKMMVMELKKMSCQRFLMQIFLMEGLV